MRHFKMGLLQDRLPELVEFVGRQNMDDTKPPLTITLHKDECFVDAVDDREYAMVTISQNVSEKGWMKRMEKTFLDFYDANDEYIKKWNEFMRIGDEDEI